jgi:CBS domain containing-hemolysin-like protein
MVRVMRFDTVSLTGLWVALAACFLGCYFAACNIALKTFSRSRLSELLEERNASDRLEPFTQRAPRLMLMTAMVRTSMVLVVLLATLSVVEQAMVGSTRLLHYVVALVLGGIQVSIFCVAIPLSWARYHPEELLAWSMPVLQLSYRLTLPMVSFLHLLDPLVRRISGASENPQEEADRASEEVLSVVEEHESSGSVDEDQRQMIEAVFDLNNTSAGEIMTPRTEVVGIDVHASLEEIRKNVLEHGHSRIPVYEETIDQIVGILYAKDLIKHLGEAPGSAFSLSKTMRQALLVPESKSVRDLLAEFKTRKVHIAIVLDEYGGTAGLVTIEDILEELVGDIQDEYEHTEEPPAVTKIDHSTAEVDARIHIDDLNDELGLELPEDEDYDTLGGFVFSTLGHIPQVGERFDFQDVAFTVTEAERTKVKRVRVELPERNGDAGADTTAGDSSGK